VEQVAGFEAQIRNLKAAGVEKIFSEQLSSVDAKRAQLEAAIEFCREGDVLRLTTSQPRSLLSIARLNRARSRTLRCICSLVRIAQTCLGSKGGFGPTSLPLFQGLRAAGRAFMF
jgi:hypothetical protein